MTIISQDDPLTAGAWAVCYSTCGLKSNEAMILTGNIYKKVWKNSGFDKIRTHACLLDIK